MYISHSQIFVADAVNDKGDVNMKNGEKITVNKVLLERANSKIKKLFKRNYTDNDQLLIMILLYLYKHHSKPINYDVVYLACEHPDELNSDNYITKKYYVNEKVLSLLKTKNSTSYLSTIVECVIAYFIITPISEYTDNISPLYTIVGSKNTTMQKATASAVDTMELSHESMTLVDACCATGSLFCGLKTYPWKEVILNDLNPLRTNFLNVIKKNPLTLIKKILNTKLTDFEQSSERTDNIKVFRNNTNTYEIARQHYHKVDCNIEIAYEMFLLQCISKQYPENFDKILNRVIRFLPAHLKLQNAIITQDDCLKYLENDETKKFVILDVPYIGSEFTCAINGYKYKPFHVKVAEYLQNAKYPFLYYCRSTPPKSDNTFTKQQGALIMKMKLAQHFMNKDLHFQKVHLKDDTELMISNQLYDKKAQFQWTEFEDSII